MLKPKDTLEYALCRSKEIPIKERHHQKIYAVITDKRGRVLSEASNSYCESNYLQRLYAKSVGRKEAKYSHAECLALQKLGKNKDKAYKITIARTLKNGTSAIAAPCPICSRAIKDFGLKSVEYSL